MARFQASTDGAWNCWGSLPTPTARRSRPRLPAALARLQHLLDGLLAKRPAERFASAEALIQEIDALEAALPAARDCDATRLVAGCEQPAARRWWLLGPKFLILPGFILLFVSGVAWFLFDPMPLSGSPNGVRLESVASGLGASVPQIDGSLAPHQVERVERLLEVAEAHMLVGRLREPVGSNAYEAYSLILEIDPTNAAARAALQQIEQTSGED